MNNPSCPHCGLSPSKKNGHTHYGKQNYQCLSCGRQFVEDSQRLDQPTRALIKKLLERIPLRGMCRVLSISRECLHFKYGTRLIEGVLEGLGRLW
ncbi:MAG: IS1 family transposase [Pyrinomonadaceae bacterium]|nr:IS1 family transposase [Pyrinomonadaceae bacterium]